ncbi:MAG: hypothetical protein ABH840_04120 [Nanoarchaeota archaeon]
MKKTELRKNVLDLEYRKNLQILNIVLISGIGAIFAFIGALILNPNKLVAYSIMMILVGSLTYLIYFVINENLKSISEKIVKLR